MSHGHLVTLTAKPVFRPPMSHSLALPPELINLILSHLCGTPSIAECALVCHSWLPNARYHLLPPPKVLHLDQLQLMGFLRLIDSPRSTLSLISVSTLHLAQNRVVMDWDNPIHPDGNAWRSHTAVNDFLVRKTFLYLTSLILRWIDWKTLSPMALTSLHTGYKSVKWLEFGWIAFTPHEFCNLIAALTALEKITLDEGVAFDSAPWTVDSVQVTHPSLCKLAFKFPFSWMIQFFAKAIRYSAGIVEVSIDLSFVVRKNELEACRGLLEVAGTSLRAIKFGTSDHDSLFVHDAELLAFPHNPNLQEIELTSVSEITLRLFMQGLKLNAKPNLRQLKLGLEDRDGLEGWMGSWVLADETLSTMLLKDPKLILELPPPWHVPSNFDVGVYESLAFKRLESLLPRTAECWKFEVVTRALS